VHDPSSRFHPFGQSTSKNACGFIDMALSGATRATFDRHRFRASVTRLGDQLAWLHQESSALCDLGE
jgi:hypothetical protein